VPIGAMLANEEVARGFEPARTPPLRRNPLATAAALYVQHVIDTNGLLEHCRDVGAHLGSSLLRLAERRKPKARARAGRGPPAGPHRRRGRGARRRARARPGPSALGGGRQRRALRAAAGRQQGEIDEAVQILDAALEGG
jgi:hypothetical protein